jgi:hypothetical protein
MKLEKFLHKHITFIAFLKHFFVPHKGNNYKPHFFKEHILLSVMAGSIFLLIISYTSYRILRTTTMGRTIAASVLIDLTNKIREQYNLPPLKPNLALEHAAILKGNDMHEKEYFSHTGPDGTTPWYWIKRAGYNFSYAGENLALNFKSSKEIETAWLNSPKHRDNILDKNYEDIGIGLVRGYVEYIPVVFTVQMFGKQTSPEENSPLYSGAHWYELFLFNLSYYIDAIYKILTIILIAELLLMIFIEIKKQHIIHILYGVLLIIVVVICILINSLLI